MNTEFELGTFTVGEPTRDAGALAGTAQAGGEQLLEWARVTDAAGLDVFGVGERWPLRRANR